MKLLMENWRQYLTEEEMRLEIMKYLEENSIVLSEEQLEEAMPRWMKKLGTGMALAGALSGVGQSAQAGVGDWFGGRKAPETHQTQEAPKEGLSEDGKSFTAKSILGSVIQHAQEIADKDARVGLLEAGAVDSYNDAAITSRTIVGDYLYSTATAQ